MTPSERAVAAKLQAENPGAIILKMAEGGMPDFVVISKRGRKLVHFVEAKAGTDDVQPRQLKKHKELRRQGLRVDVIRIDEVGGAWCRCKVNCIENGRCHYFSRDASGICVNHQRYFAAKAAASDGKVRTGWNRRPTATFEQAWKRAK